MSFLKWLVDAINKAVEWISSIPGLVVTFLGTCVSTVTASFTFFSGQSSTVSQYVGNISTAANNVGQYVSNNTLLSTLCYMFSIDTAWTYLSTLGGLFLGLFGFLFVTLIEALFLLLFAVMLFKTTRWIASLITLGVSKF